MTGLKFHGLLENKVMRASSNLKTGVGKLSCTTLRVVNPAMRSVAQPRANLKTMAYFGTMLLFYIAVFTCIFAETTNLSLVQDSAPSVVSQPTNKFPSVRPARKISSYSDARPFSYRSIDACVLVTLHHQ